jgi:ClpP class serine protease
MRNTAILLSLLAVIALAAVFGAKKIRPGSQGKKNLVFKDNRIGVLPVYGPIESSQDVVRWLRRFDRQVKGIRAVVLDVNSPGGGSRPLPGNL